MAHINLTHSLPVRLFLRAKEKTCKKKKKKKVANGATSQCQPRWGLSIAKEKKNRTLKLQES